MKKNYSIIIPVYNEGSKLPELLRGLRPLSIKGHEIIIINDGSNDDSSNILQNCNFVESITFENNRGKGLALREGLKNAKNNKIITFDGDLELHPDDIKHLMILDKDEQIDCVLGSRYDKINLFNSFWDFGNYVFTTVFNLIYGKSIKDALCCAKSFYSSDLNMENLTSKKFDIDIELTKEIVKNCKNICTIKIKYHRRLKRDGKKLKLKDSFLILKRILFKN